MLLRPITRCQFPFLAVRRSQTEAQSAFFNLKGQPALFVIVDLAAALRVLLRKCCQPLFQIGIVGLHLDHTTILVKIDGGSLFSLGKSCSHKTSCFRKFFSALELEKWCDFPIETLQTMQGMFRHSPSADLLLFRLLTVFSCFSICAAFQPFHKLMFHYQFSPADP